MNTTIGTAREPYSSETGPNKFTITDQMRERIEQTFTYHLPQDDQPERFANLREQAKVLALLICAWVPPGREQALALQQLEEVIFWANAGISREE